MLGVVEPHPDLDGIALADPVKDVLHFVSPKSRPCSLSRFGSENSLVSVRNLNEKVCFSWDKTVFQLTDGLRVLHTMMLWLPVQVTHSFRLCPNWMTHSSRRKVGWIHSVTPKNDLYAHTRSKDGADAPGEDWARILHRPLWHFGLEMLPTSFELSNFPIFS